MPQSFKDLGVTDKPFPVRTRMLGRAWPLRAPVRDGRVPSWQEFASGVPSGVPCMVSISTISFPHSSIFSRDQSDCALENVVKYFLFIHLLKDIGLP